MSTEFPEAFDDLLEAQFATLATIGKDGSADLKEDDGPDDRRVVVTIEPANVFAVDMNA
jgi:hypothetical protein